MWIFPPLLKFTIYLSGQLVSFLGFWLETPLLSGTLHHRAILQKPEINNPGMVSRLAGTAFVAKKRLRSPLLKMPFFDLQSRLFLFLQESHKKSILEMQTAHQRTIEDLERKHQVLHETEEWQLLITARWLLSIVIDISQRTCGSPGYPDIDLHNPLLKWASGIRWQSIKINENRSC